jgi:leucyl aminopeptidase
VCFGALALSQVTGILPDIGTLFYGECYRQRTVKTGKHLAQLFAHRVVDALDVELAGECPLHGIDDGELGRALTSKEFQAKPYEWLFVPIADASWRARRVMIIGGGGSERGTDLVRRLATASGLAARQRSVVRAAFVVRGSANAADLAQAVAEGLTLAEFYGGSYKTDDPPPAASPIWTVIAADEVNGAGVQAQLAVARGRILGQCSNLARELSNEPGNVLPPREFARRATALASEAGVQTEILDEKQIEKLGMGLLLGVGRGSAEPPRVMVFRYDPPGAPVLRFRTSAPRARRA